MAHPAPAQTQAHAPEPHGDGHSDHDAHHDVNYVKIYWVLVVLLIVSVIGPFVGDALHMKAITLITAFGIAAVKAYIVAANFMHLRFEKRYIVYLMFTAVAFMFLFYAGVSPDVMRHRGRLWENVAAQEEIERAQEAAGQNAHGGH
jgi:caa(3)-type oxidase subunit IV